MMSIGSLWDKFVDYFHSWGSLQLQSMKFLIALITFALTYIKPLMDYVCSSLLILTTKVASLAVPSFSAAYISTGWDYAAPYLAIANYVLPVQEAFVVCSAMSILWIVATSYRFIKSWIPTVN